jgi:hypothetical protein
MKRGLTLTCVLENPGNSDLKQFYDFGLKSLNLRFKFQRKLSKIKKIGLGR